MNAAKKIGVIAGQTKNVIGQGIQKGTDFITADSTKQTVKDTGKAIGNITGNLFNLGKLFVKDIRSGYTDTQK